MNLSVVTLEPYTATRDGNYIFLRHGDDIGLLLQFSVEDMQQIIAAVTPLLQDAAEAPPVSA